MTSFPNFLHFSAGVSVRLLIDKLSEVVYFAPKYGTVACPSYSKNQFILCKQSHLGAKAVQQRTEAG